jgi:hypothetical protein
MNGRGILSNRSPPAMTHVGSLRCPAFGGLRLLGLDCLRSRPGVLGGLPCACSTRPQGIQPRRPFGLAWVRARLWHGSARYPRAVTSSAGAGGLRVRLISFGRRSLGFLPLALAVAPRDCYSYDDKEGKQDPIIAIRPDWHHDDIDKGTIKVVYTGGPGDLQDIRRHVRRPSQVIQPPSLARMAQHACTGLPMWSGS